MKEETRCNFQLFKRKNSKIKFYEVGVEWKVQQVK